MRRFSPSSFTRHAGARVLAFPTMASRALRLVVLGAGLGVVLATPASAVQTQAKVKQAESPPSTTPLSKFVPKDNLIVYIEFGGTEANADAWKKTAAYRMLNETPLGEMLEAVGGQLLDKALAFVPSIRLSGADLVALFKHATRFGWVLSVSADPKGAGASAGGSLQGAFVLHGGAGKPIISATSKILGLVMGNQARPTTESKAGRTIVRPPAPAQGAGAAAAPGWVWWAENTDLVIALFSPASADSIIAALDGKAPCAAEHPVVRELKKPEGTFLPVCVAFADLANCPESAGELARGLRSGYAEWGISRVDYRWGFDDDALMAVSRLAAPKPRKGLLAVLDQPIFGKTTLLPRPEGVDSFVELSLSPSQLVAIIGELWPESEVNARIDDLAGTIRAAGQIDLNKDLLAYVGPRMMAYVGPGRSAATDDDSLESALKDGFNPAAAMKALQAAYPRVTLIAEVRKPEAFSKALDAAIIAINGELKAVAKEKAREQEATKDQQPGGGAGAPGGRMAAGRAGGAGGQTGRRRSVNTVHAPSLVVEESTATTRSFVLRTPTDSPLKFGSSHFRPTIQLDGKYLAIGVSPDAARTALAAVRKKDWKPSASLQKISDHIPSNLVALVVNDVGETLPSLLASLPGTLQTMINSATTVAKMQAAGGNNQAGGAAGRGGQQPGATMGGPGGRMGMVGRGRMGMAPGGAGAGPAGAPRGADQGQPGAGSSNSSDPSMVIFQIDADKMPKSADLKPMVFPSAYWIAVTDQEIRFVSRSAFPDISGPISLVPLLFVMPAMQTELAKLQAAQQAASAGAVAQPATGPAQAPPAAQPKMQGPGGQPGGRRGRPPR